MIYLQGGIFIHCIPTRGHSHHGTLPWEHSHHGILSMRHLHHCIPIKGHSHSSYTPKQTFASWHTLKETLAFIAYPSGHSHSLHPYKGHLHHGMHQWDIRIMKIASLKGDMCIIRTFHIYILVKSICIENKKI